MNSRSSQPCPRVVSGLRKTFGRASAAISELSLAVRAGELMALVGPSACGKTTTLRLIAGLDQPDAGTIELDGIDCIGRVPSARNVAMVLQDAMLYPHLTVHRNIAFALQSEGPTAAEIDRRALEAARICNIEHLLDRKPATLSGGEQQRAALARAIARQPAVLLLDEPLNSVDAPLRWRLRQDLKAVQRRLGITTVFVTHDQEEALAVGDRVAVMNNGSIQQVGTPIEVFQRPANRFVAGFFGQPPMNLIPGQIVRDGRSVVFTDRGNIQIDLTVGLGPRAEHLALRDVILGVRPEHLRLAPECIDRERPMIRVDFVSTEFLGACFNAQFRTASGGELFARVPQAQADHVEAVRAVSMDPLHIHLFESGAAGGNLLAAPITQS